MSAKKLKKLGFTTIMHDEFNSEITHTHIHILIHIYTHIYIFFPI